MNNKTKTLAYSALMCAMLIVSTLWLKFPVPGTEILFTTQVLFVLLCGQLMPPSGCAYAIGAYILLGLLGLPIFSATQGVAVIATPTFGYLLGFPFSAMAVAWVRAKLKNAKAGRYIASLAGIIVLYLIALPYIALLNGLYLSRPVPLSVLLSTYCLAFLPLDFVKGLLAAFIAERIAKAMSSSMLSFK